MATTTFTSDQPTVSRVSSMRARIRRLPWPLVVGSSL